MMSRQDLINNMKANIKKLEEMEDGPILGMTDEGGYCEEFRPMSYFGLHILNGDEVEEDDEGSILVHIEFGFED